jgi:hypothetical protein
MGQSLVIWTHGLFCFRVKLNACFEPPLKVGAIENRIVAFAVADIPFGALNVRYRWLSVPEDELHRLEELAPWVEEGFHKDFDGVFTRR